MVRCVVWCWGRAFPGPIVWAHEARVQGTPCQNWEPPRAANLPQAVERQLIQPGGHTCAGWASSYEEHGVGLHGAKVSPLGGHRRLSVEKKQTGTKLLLASTVVESCSISHGTAVAVEQVATRFQVTPCSLRAPYAATHLSRVCVIDSQTAKASPRARLPAARRAAAGHAALLCVPVSEFDIELTPLPGPRKRARKKDTARVTDCWGSWAA